MFPVCFRTWPERGRGGFTLAEVLVVVAILSILTLCVMRAAGSATDRADLVRCVGNLRSIHLALTTYVTDKSHWPQCPHDMGEEGFDEWWMNELKQYKISDASWSCPALLRQEHLSKQDHLTGQAKIHYVPTNFDENPYTPRRWPRQPWLLEIADSHGEGNLLVFPDGSIIGSTRYLSQNQ